MDFNITVEVSSVDESPTDLTLPTSQRNIENACNATQPPSSSTDAPIAHGNTFDKSPKESASENSNCNSSISTQSASMNVPVTVNSCKNKQSVEDGTFPINLQSQKIQPDSTDSSIKFGQSAIGRYLRVVSLPMEDSNDSTLSCSKSVVSNESTSTWIEESFPSDSNSNDSQREEINHTPDRRSSKKVVADGKLKKVDFFTEDFGPKWYNVSGCTVTKNILSYKIPEAFQSLPIHGKPDTIDELPEFLDKKVQEFVGSGLTDEEFLKLQKSCSENLLRTGEEPIMKTVAGSARLGFLIDFLPWKQTTNNLEKEYQLQVVKRHKIRLDNDPCRTYTKQLKYRGVRILPMAQPNDSPLAKEEEPSTSAASAVEPDLEPGQDLLYVVRMYRPFANTRKSVQHAPPRHSLFNRNIILVGRQKLTDLRDRILCANDVDLRVDVSDRINESPTASAKNIFPSGFLFINNVFYVDTRTYCHDISETIRRWARNKPYLGEFPVRDMAAVRLHEILVKLGHPEVYMHQGNCEHLFTFSDIRLLGPSDPLTLSQYPCHTAVSQNQTVYCTNCVEFSAKWVITGCERIPFDPAFCCENCIKYYMYKDGKKVGNFKAYAFKGNDIDMLKPLG